MMSFSLVSNTEGVLLDITGVLYESGCGPIEGSSEAIERLRHSKIPFRFITNDSQQTLDSLVTSLGSLGFKVSSSEIFSPSVAAAAYVKQMQLRPFLLIHPGLLPQFSECDTTSPNCVIIGDAAEYFTFENMNKAFNVLLKSENPVLISLGKGKYYKDKEEIVIDLGGFTCCLEYAASVEAKVIGKPAPDYFMTALKDMGIEPSQAVMVGDDICSDVHAAQQCGIKGVLVKTGKFRESDMNHPNIKPDAIVNNLADFVDLLLNK